MNCNTCRDLAKWCDSTYPTTIVKKGLAVTSYKGHEIRFKKKIVRCEECGDLWHIDYSDETCPSLFTSLHKIFVIEHETDPSNWGGAEYVSKVMQNIVVNTPIAIEEKI